MATHTSGLWEARPNEADNGEWEVVKPDASKPYAEDPWFVCVCFDAADGSPAEANARLIAAAPDMLDALLCARVIVEGAPVTLGRSIALEKIDGALAKARGEA